MPRSWRKAWSAVNARNDDAEDSPSVPPDPSGNPDFAQLRRRAEQQARALESNEVDAAFARLSLRAVPHRLRNCI